MNATIALILNAVLDAAVIAGLALVLRIPHRLGYGRNAGPPASGV